MHVLYTNTAQLVVVMQTTTVMETWLSVIGIDRTRTEKNEARLTMKVGSNTEGDRRKHILTWRYRIKSCLDTVFCWKCSDLSAEQNHRSQTRRLFRYPRAIYMGCVELLVRHLVGMPGGWRKSTWPDAATWLQQQRCQRRYSNAYYFLACWLLLHNKPLCQWTSNAKCTSCVTILQKAEYLEIKYSGEQLSESLQLQQTINGRAHYCPLRAIQSNWNYG